MLILENKGKIKSDIALNIAKDLVYHKAEDVVVYDVETLSPFFSFIIVCTADNTRKVSALKDSAVDSLYSFDKNVKQIDGRNGSNWIVIDGYDILIHVFDRNERERVKIDDLYSDCNHQIVDDNTEINTLPRKE